MNTTEIFNILIAIHALSGGVALASGSLAAITKKGSKPHIRCGQVFYYSLGVSIAISLIVALMPGHYNLFLFSIGIFSGYFIVIGKRAIKYKNPTNSFTSDQYIHIAMSVVCISMIVVPIILLKQFHAVAGIFGMVGLFFAGKNLSALRNPSRIRQDWLRLHISHISGGYIAAVIAFVVVNNILPGVYGWFVPGIIGTMFIKYSTRKIDRLIQSKTTYGSLHRVIPFFIAISLFHVQESNGQNDAVHVPYGKEIGLRLGFSKTKIQDQRLSAKSFSNWSPKYGLVFGTRKENSWIQNQLDFTYVKGHKKDPYFTINSILISHTYSYQRKVSDGLWLGGFTNHRSILNFPKSLYKSIFTNNAISYSIAQTLGPKISYTNTQVYDDQKNDIMGLTSVEFPVLAYLIQPIYGHPYPRKYLKEDTFDPSRAGMAVPMLKSGKLVSIRRYKSINLSFSIFYYVSNRSKIGANYQGELLYANANCKAVRLLSNDFIINPSYLY